MSGFWWGSPKRRSKRDSRKASKSLKGVARCQSPQTAQSPCRRHWAANPKWRIMSYALIAYVLNNPGTLNGVASPKPPKTLEKKAGSESLRKDTESRKPKARLGGNHRAAGEAISTGKHEMHFSPRGGFKIESTNLNSKLVSSPRSSTKAETIQGALRTYWVN